MKVNIIVQDINDNKPELAVDEIFVCENDITNTVNTVITVDVCIQLDIIHTNICVTTWRPGSWEK